MVLISQDVHSSWNAVIFGMVLNKRREQICLVLTEFLLNKYKLLLRLIILLRHLIGHGNFFYFF
jgi:hypothetical protein